MPPREDGRGRKGERDTRLPKVEKRLLRVKPTFLRKSKYRHLLDDIQVNRWFHNLLRGSAVTAAERLRRLGWLCEHFDTSPQEMAKLRRREAEDFLYDMVIKWQVQFESSLRALGSGPVGQSGIGQTRSAARVQDGSERRRLPS